MTQNADGSGFVVVKEGDDDGFGADSVVIAQADGNVKVREPLAGGLGFDDLKFKCRESQKCVEKMPS